MTITITLTDSERWYVSMALSHLVDLCCIDVPEENLPELLELHSKFLTPEDITA